MLIITTTTIGIHATNMKLSETIPSVSYLSGPLFLIYGGQKMYAKILKKL